MIEDKNSTIAYIFSFVRHMPASRKELLGISHIKLQAIAIKGYAARNGLTSPRYLIDVSTYRAGGFFGQRNFQHAVAQAFETAQPIMVADLVSLLGKLAPLKASELIRLLDELDIEIFDCTQGKSWRAFAPGEKGQVVVEVCGRNETSLAIKRGKKQSAARAPEAVRRNAKLGATANRRRVDQDALMHSTSCRRFFSSKPPSRPEP